MGDRCWVSLRLTVPHEKPHSLDRALTSAGLFENTVCYARAKDGGVAWDHGIGCVFGSFPDSTTGRIVTAPGALFHGERAECNYGFLRLNGDVILDHRGEAYTYLEEYLQAHGIAYVKTNGAGAGYSEGIEWWHPWMENPREILASDGDPAVPLEVLDQFITRMTSTPRLFDGASAQVILELGNLLSQYRPYEPGADCSLAEMKDYMRQVLRAHKEESV